MRMPLARQSASMSFGLCAVTAFLRQSMQSYPTEAKFSTCGAGRQRRSRSAPHSGEVAAQHERIAGAVRVIAAAASHFAESRSTIEPAGRGVAFLDLQEHRLHAEARQA